jgi:hypothetical protein
MPVSAYRQLSPHSPDEAGILSALATIMGENAVACGGPSGAAMSDPTGEASRGALKLDFDRRLVLQFRGSAITSDAGLLPYRELDDALSLTDTGADVLSDTRTGRNGRHAWPAHCASRCSDARPATRTCRCRPAVP